MAKLKAKDGVVEIVPSDNQIKVLKETDGVKTIQVETPFKKKRKPSLGPKTKGMGFMRMKGVRIAKRGGGRAYGKNS